jgi:ATP-binding cassette subfamily C (CFTR/MRP) protein 1
MKESFQRRVANGDKYPLLWAMHETFFKEFWLGGLFQLSSSILQVMSPFTLRYLIQFSTDAYIASSQGLPAPHIGAGIGLVLGVTAMQILQSLGTNHFIYRGMLIGGMNRASLISLIYEKSMVISGRAKAGGAELPDIPAAKVVEKESEKKGKGKGGEKGAPEGQAGVAGDGTGWGNGRVVRFPASRKNAKQVSVHC